jgi:hypothetical protein
LTTSNQLYTDGNGSKSSKGSNSSKGKVLGSAALESDRSILRMVRPNMGDSDDLERLDQAYRVIGVTPDSSALRIKRAYRRLAKTWHPDKWPLHSAEGRHAGERMRVINDAFKLIQHAPLRYQTEGRRKVDTRPTSTHQPPMYDAPDITDRLEYIVRIVTGAVFGCVISFMWLLSDLPLLTAGASAIYGDRFWRWVLTVWWL